MDKRLILAVAGSGKTTFLIGKLDLEKRFLVVTYTDNNVTHIKKTIIEKFGYEPKNISVMSYFQFLIHVCYRPFLGDKVNDRGLTWKMPDPMTLRLKRTNCHFYITKERLLYHNRIAKLCQDYCSLKIKERIEKFYDYFMFDEVQDLGGHDFNLIQAIIPTNIDCLFVGDYYQHTFDTSNDGIINCGLYKDYKKYKCIWGKKGVTVDEATLSNSYRCSPTICGFVTDKLGVSIASHRTDETKIEFCDNQKEADDLYMYNSIVKLFYSESSKYKCFAENWGKSKGLDSFNDVCIVLNETTQKAFKAETLSTLKRPTLNKLYVAITRAKGNIYFLPDKYIKQYKCNMQFLI
ncbi:MAG: AAA family ATPase [Bacteroidales bacterium]|nr:AAA family ATPase [Bacteroidales bacterium]